MTHGLIFDIKKYSIHDGPGIRTTIFFKGCPLSCWWCHNPESQSSQMELMLHEQRCIHCGACLAVCPQAAIAWTAGEPITDRAKCERCGVCTASCYAEARECVGRELTVEQVMAEIERDVAFYDESRGGVTFSGGEPLLQHDFLLALLRACQAKAIHTAVETSGFAAWDIFERIRGSVDLFLYDLKLLDNLKHRTVTGVPNPLILKNLEKLSERGQPLVIRVPIIPGINDDDEAIRQIGTFVSALPGLLGVEILPYHNLAVDKYLRLGKPYRLFETRRLAAERLVEIVHTLRQFGLSVTLGG